ncbi:hypothetical protein ABZ299_28990, partial [Streptomyces sp. NPDC006184]
MATRSSVAAMAASRRAAGTVWPVTSRMPNAAGEALRAGSAGDGSRTQTRDQATGFDVPVEPLRRAAHYTGEPGCIADA